MVHKVVDQLLPLLVDVNSIHTADVNPKDHRVTDLQELAKSLDMFGQRKPIVVNMNTMEIEAGNGTYIAAKEYLGWTHIAALCIDDTEETHLSYAIADNRTSELSSWNYDNMSIILGTLDKVSVPGVDSDFLLRVKPKKNEDKFEQEPLKLKDFLENFNMKDTPVGDDRKFIQIEVRKEDYYELYTYLLESLSALEIEVKIT